MRRERVVKDNSGFYDTNILIAYLFKEEDKFIKIKDSLHKLFKIIPINQDICIKASYIRRDYKIPEIDSIILATSIYAKFRHFYTFDKDFEKLNNKIINQTKIHYLGKNNYIEELKP